MQSIFGPDSALLDTILKIQREEVPSEIVFKDENISTKVRKKEERQSIGDISMPFASRYFNVITISH